MSPVILPWFDQKLRVSYLRASRIGRYSESPLMSGEVKAYQPSGLNEQRYLNNGAIYPRMKAGSARHRAR